MSREPVWQQGTGLGSPCCPLRSINQERDPDSMGWLCNTFEGAPYREKFVKRLILFYKLLNVFKLKFKSLLKIKFNLQTLCVKQILTFFACIQDLEIVQAVRDGS